MPEAAPITYSACFRFMAPPDVKSAVEQAARAQGVRPSEWLRAAVREKLADAKDPR